VHLEEFYGQNQERRTRAAQRLVLDIEQAGGGCILDLGCHCVEISRSFIGKTSNQWK